MQEFDAGWEVSVKLRRLIWLLRANIVVAKARQLQHALRASKYNPNQPRVPRGNPDGGEWTRTGGGAGAAASGDDVAQILPPYGRIGPGQYRLRNGRLVETTPTQEARLAAVEAEASHALRQVQEIDPNWKPRPSLIDPDSIEGDIARAEAETREAREHLFELAQQPGDDLIDAYRRQRGLDLFGEEIWSRERHTVAVCKVGDVPFVGMNSQALTYTDADRRAATQLRSVLVEKYPCAVSTENTGQFPNDSFFHAE